MNLARTFQLFGWLVAFSASAASQNILLLIADDYGVDSSSLYNSAANGASLPPTPNINALAQSGVLFRNAYANPVCSPTRACMITGRFSFRTGIGDAITGPTSPSLKLSEFTLPEAFAANPSAGYQVAQFGKWHLATGANSPSTFGGWPHFAGSIPGALPNYTNWTKTVNGSSTANYTNYATTDVVNDAITWIQSRGSQPWFAWVAFNAAHTPLHKPPTNLCPHYASLPGTPADINLNPRPYFEAMVEAMDTEMGRLLAAVDRTNTHVLFLGDNGTSSEVLQPPYPVGRGKSTLYEGGTKVPMIIAGPAVVNPGRTNNTLVHAVDLFATILELGGINGGATIPTNIVIDSKSLLPLLQNNNTITRHVYTELFGDSIANNQDGRALRNDQFKLIQFNDGREEFYDLLGDPYEGTNLLNRALTTTEQANYYALTMKFGEYQETLSPPMILNYSRTSGQFSVTVQRQSGLGYNLWRSSTMAYLGWAPVTNAVVTTNGIATITLTDLNPPAPPQFYRVEARTP